MKYILFIFLFSSVILAQSSGLQNGYPIARSNGVEWLYKVADADSGTTQIGTFDIDAFDNDLHSYPLGWEVVVDTASSTDGAGIIAGVFVQGKYEGGSWTTCDTLLAVDTLYAHTAHTGLTSLVAQGVANLNQVTKAFPKYRGVVVISSGSGDASTWYIRLYARKRD